VTDSAINFDERCCREFLIPLRSAAVRAQDRIDGRKAKNDKCQCDCQYPVHARSKYIVPHI
jgi:hypothetical protein